jgi:O-antigen/teichoic acid export membrane protein
MIRYLKKLPFQSETFKSIGIYTIAGFLNKGIAFLFLPLLTAYLQPSDYGIVTLFSNAIALITPFISLSVITSVSTDYFKYDKASFRTYFSSVLLLPVLSTVIVSIFLLIIGNRMAAYLEVPVQYLYALPVLALAGFFFELLLTLLRNRNKPVFFAFLTVTKTIFEIAGSALLIIVVSMGWRGRVLGWLITGVLLILYALYYFNKNEYLTKKVDPRYLPGELKYSIPIIVNQFAIFIIMSSDKFFIAKYLNTEEVGIYGVAGQFAFIAFAVSASMIMFFNPYLYKALSEKDEKKKKEISRRIVKFVTLMFFICIVIALITPLLYQFFINGKYHRGMPYVKWILLAYFFWFVYWLLLGFLYFYKLKKTILIISALSITLAVVLNYLLIPKYGTIGAIYSLNISCFAAMAILALVLRYRYRFI